MDKWFIATHDCHYLVMSLVIVIYSTPFISNTYLICFAVCWSLCFALFVGSFSYVTVEFVFKRNNIYHVINNFFPALLIVILSWMAFWIDKSNTPEKVSIAVITALTMESQVGRSIPSFFLCIASITYKKIFKCDLKWTLFYCTFISPRATSFTVK